MDKISVIVPVYNVEKYLKKCVQSILNQTYKNLEIILIDDGSTDTSGSICDDLATNDCRIKVVHKENTGLSSTRNYGLDICTGEYVAFVDSDDYITFDFFQTLYDALFYNECDIASVNLRMVREDGYKITTSDDLKDETNDGKIKVYSGSEIIKEVLLRKSFKNYTCTKLYRKKIFDECRFKENVLYEDILFMYEVSKIINKIAYVNKECYFYLKRANSVTATCSEKNINDFLDVVIYRYDDISLRNVAEKKFNIYALIEAIISISIKYTISNCIFESIEKKSRYIFEIIDGYIKEHEIEIIPLLSNSQKASLYLINYNIELFYDFLKNRQELKKKLILD